MNNMEEDFFKYQEWIQDKKSITPSGFFGNSAESIQAREAFMTDHELEFLSKAAREIDTWDVTETHYNDDGVVIYNSDYWANRVASRPILDQINPEISNVINQMVLRFKKEVDSYFSVKAIPTSPAIVRWLPGQEQKPHADKELWENGTSGPNDFPHYDIAGLFYLNDDYEGGELYFPLQDIEFKPKPGAAYFFPGDKNFIHGVRPITSGIRYVVPFFWTIVEHTGDVKP